MLLHEDSLSPPDCHQTVLESVFRVELVFAVRFELQQPQTTENARVWSHGGLSASELRVARFDCDHFKEFYGSKPHTQNIKSVVWTVFSFFAFFCLTSPPRLSFWMLFVEAQLPSPPWKQFTSGLGIEPDSYTRVQPYISTRQLSVLYQYLHRFKRSCLLPFGVVQVQTNCKQQVLRKKLTLGQSGSGPEGLRTSWTCVCTSARFQQIRGHERQI